MKLGFSEACINPDHPVELSGYGYYPGRLTREVMDDLYVRAVYLVEGDERLLLINCDLLALCPYLVHRVREALAGELGIPHEQVLLLSIHTHTAPTSTQTIGCGEVDWPYIEFLAERICLAGVTAAKSLYPVRRITGGSRAIDPVGYNRAAPGGPVDPNVYALCFELEGSRPYVLANYACHPVTLGPIRVISPDFPGEVVESLHRMGFEGMFLNGFCGDIDPVSNMEKWGSGTKETIREYGERIAGAAAGLCGAGEEQPLSLHTRLYTFRLPLAELGFAEVDGLARRLCEGEAEESPLRRAVGEWTRRVKWAIMDLPNGFEQIVTIQAAEIGNTVLVGMQGELYTQIGLDARALAGDVPLMLCGNANAALRYVATDEEISAGTYGGISSNIVYGTLPVPEGTARLFSEEIAKAVKQLKDGVHPVSMKGR